MQMIDVMKRLAELDSTNPTIVKESQQVEECGIMPEMGMGMEKPAMPASINMTAGSGEELSDMLATIMQLAGVKQHGAEEPMSAEPTLALTAEPEMGSDATSDMRSMIDKLNPGDDVNAAHGDVDNDGDHDMADHEAEKDEEETDEGQYDNSPSDPTKPPPFKANQFAHQENQPGQGDRMDGNMPKATMEQQLMADYKKFVSEGNKKVDEINTALVNKVHDARQQNAQQAWADDSDEHSARIQAKADSMGKSKWDRSVTVEPGPLAAAADAAQQKLKRNKQLTAKRPNSNYGRDQAELGAWGQRVGQTQGSGR